MTLKTSSLIIQLTIAYLITCLLTDAMCANKFDLNSIPDEDQPDEIKSYSSNPTKMPVESTNARHASVNFGEKKKKGQTISPTFYAKVLKLMDILKICDDKNFDINKIEIPKSFSAENRAIMALSKVAQSNLIKRKDIGRFRLIMDNCDQLARAVQTNIENSMSVDSQTSGGTYEDRLKRLSESPMEVFKSRFDDARIVSYKDQAKTAPAKELKPIDDNRKNESSFGPVYRLEDSFQNDQTQVIEPPNYIQFL